MGKGNNEKMQLAREAEKEAEAYLYSRGYAVRARNWRPHPSPYEVDIIAQKGSTMVFVEVKARRKMRADEAVDAVDPKKQKFIARAADIYLRMEEHLFYYRFDIIVVVGEGEDKQLLHIEDAFMPPLSSVGGGR